MDNFMTNVDPDAGYQIAHTFVSNQLAAVAFESLQGGFTLDFLDAADQTKAARVLLLVQGGGEEVAAVAQAMRDFADHLEQESASRGPTPRQ